ncbi:MotA/TolQ/ExbB proton channel family protein [Rufibacter soli]
MLFIPILLQVSTPEGGASLSIFSMLMKGGVVMIPILLLSMAAVYFFMERLLFLKTVGKTDQAFIQLVGQKVQQGQVQEAISLCQIQASPAARLLEKGMSRLGSPVRDIESAIENSAQVEVYQMERHMGYLSAIAAIAPMMGFLGTVTGMIKAFYHISLADNISIGIIAGGIYEKMITSAAGLVVGMLAFVFHTLLHAQIEKTVHKLEVISIQFMDLLFKVPQYELQEN